MVSSSERVKQSKKIVILIVLQDAEDQDTVILNCRELLVRQHHISENFNPQQYSCVHNLPCCPQKELFKKYGLEYGVFYL